MSFPILFFSSILAHKYDFQAYYDKRRETIYHIRIVDTA